MNQSISRQVSLKVQVNGVALPAAVSAEVTNKTHFAADEFRVELAIGGLPNDKPLNWWAESEQIEMEVFVGLDGKWFSLIRGDVDEVEIQLVRGCVALHGRDFTGRFIDRKVSASIKNQTASQIVEKLAVKRGLRTSVNGVSTIQNTTTKVGKYYQIDHVVVSSSQTEWDLIVQLARQERFDVWASGDVLYFQPPPVDTAQPYTLNWIAASPVPTANFVNICMKRRLTLAKGVLVTVRSWNQAQEVAYIKHAPRNLSKAAMEKAEKYEYTVANLAGDQCQAYADAMLKDIIMHERLIDVDLPGDIALSTRRKVSLSGTGTSFDQLYFPHSIERSISTHEGYRMQLRANNHSPLSTETVL